MQNNSNTSPGPGLEPGQNQLNKCRVGQTQSEESEYMPQ